MRASITHMQIGFDQFYSLVVPITVFHTFLLADVVVIYMMESELQTTHFKIIHM